MSFTVLGLIICLVALLINYSTFKYQVKNDIEELRSDLEKYQKSMSSYFFKTEDKEDRENIIEEQTISTYEQSDEVITETELGEETDEEIQENDYEATLLNDEEIIIQPQEIHEEIKEEKEEQPIKEIRENIISPVYSTEEKIQEELNTKNKPFNFEKIFLDNIYNKVGALSIIIALCYFLSGVYLTPLMQIITAYIVGIGIFGLSVFMKNRNEKYKSFSGVIMGISLASMFIVTYYGASVSSVIPEQVGFILGIVLLIAAYFESKYFDSVAFIVIGLLGGYLTPYIVNPSANINSLALYFIFMNIVSAIYVNLNPKNKFINSFNIIITSCILLLSDINFILRGEDVSFIFPITLWCVYFVSEILFSLKDTNYSNNTLSVINYIIFFIFTLIEFIAFENDYKKIALVYVPLTVIYMAVSYIMNNKNKSLSDVYNNLGICSIILALSFALEDLLRIFALILGGLTIIFINKFKNKEKYVLWANIYLIMVVIFTALYPNEGARIAIGLGIPTFLILLNKFINTDKYYYLNIGYFICALVFTALYPNEGARIAIALGVPAFLILLNKFINTDKYYSLNIGYFICALVFTALYPNEGARIAIALGVPTFLILLNKFINTEKYANINSIYFIVSIIFTACCSSPYLRIFIPEITAILLLCLYDFLNLDKLKDCINTNYVALFLITGLFFISYSTETLNIFGLTIYPDAQRVYLTSIMALIIIFIAVALKKNNYIKYGVSYIFASYFALLFVHGLYIVDNIENYKPVLSYRTPVFFTPIITSFICAYKVKDILPNIYQYLKFLAITGIYVYLSLETNFIITKQQGLTDYSYEMYSVVKYMTMAMIGFTYTLNMLRLAKMTKFVIFEYAALAIYFVSLITIYFGCTLNWYEYFIPIVNIRFIAFIFAIVVTYMLSGFYNIKKIQYLMPVIGLSLVYFEANDYLNKISFDVAIIKSAIIIVYSSILILIGLLRNNDIMKKAGIIITDIILVKMLIFDISNLDTTIKVFVYMVTGAMLLLVSFFYTKIIKKE